MRFRIFQLFRGYLRIIFALGLVFASADHAYAKSPPKQALQHETVANSLSEIAATYSQEAKRALKPDKQAEPCKRGYDRRYSDLCAQWKAADAAADSAWWAWAGGIIGLGSLVGVFAAIGLAYHANWIARDTARRQLRAYIAVDACEITSDAETNEFILTARLKNSGQTPAYAVRVMGESFGGDYPLKEDKPFSAIVDGYSAPLNPGSEICCAKRVSTTSHSQTVELVLTDDFGLYIQGICSYTDVFGKQHETKFRYVFAGQPASMGMIMHAAETGNVAT